VHVAAAARQAVQPVLVHAVQAGEVAVPDMKKPGAQTAAVTVPLTAVQLARFATVPLEHAVQAPLLSAYNGRHPVTVVAGVEVPAATVHTVAEVLNPDPPLTAAVHVAQVFGVSSLRP
jgi:uncharacterized protein YciW